MNPFAMQGMMEKLSDAELARMASNPPAPMAQLLAIQALDQRKQMRMSAVPAPQTTVLEDRVAQSMPMPQSSAASDPIRSGLGAIMSQMPPRQMSGGGSARFYDDLEAAIPQMRQFLPNVGPQTPEEWLAAARSFRGEDRLAPFADRLGGREKQFREDRRRDRWMALARAGLGMMGPGGFWRNVGRGGLAGLEAFNEAEGDYRSGMDRVLGSQISLAQSQQARDDATGQAAMSGFTTGIASQNANNRSALEGGLASATGAQRERIANADRSAANWRALQNDMTILADRLLDANEGETVREDKESPVSNIRDQSPTRPYDRRDALQDAISALGGRGRGGRSATPDDLNEILRAATFLADPMNGADEPTRAQARRVMNGILNGTIGNANSSTGGLAASQGVATGTLAPQERVTERGQARGSQTGGRVAPAAGTVEAFQAGRNAGDIIPSRESERRAQQSAR